MDKSLFLSRKAEGRFVNRSMVFTNVALAAALAFSVHKLSQDHERLVIVPPHLSEQAELSWSKANEPYLKSMGLYIATLIGNITPANVDFVVTQISTLLAPDVYVNARRALMQLAQDPIFRNSGAVSTFAPGNLVYERATNKVFIPGKFVVATAGTRPEERPVVYELVIEIRSGKPLVTHLDSYEGSEARTLLWKANASKSQNS